MIQKKFKISYVIMMIIFMFFVITLSTLSYGVPSNAARTPQENNTISNEITTTQENTSNDSTLKKDVTNDDVILTRSNSKHR